MKKLHGVDMKKVMDLQEIAEKLKEFIWERGKMLAPSSMASEVTYYNNIREFLIDRKIQSLD